jgi:phage shock protein A
MRNRFVGAGLALFVMLAVAGCGQVASLQKENLALKGEMTTLKADAEAMKKQFAELTTQKQALEDQVKEAEAKLAARPGTKPPLKAKKSS